MPMTATARSMSSPSTISSTNRPLPLVRWQPACPLTVGTPRDGDLKVARTGSNDYAKTPQTVNCTFYGERQRTGARSVQPGSGRVDQSKAEGVPGELLPRGGEPKGDGSDARQRRGPRGWGNVTPRDPPPHRAADSPPHARAARPVVGGRRDMGR